MSVIPIEVAIVDDHLIYRKAIKRVLARVLPSGKFTEAENGQEFIDLLMDHTFDLVIMDIKMPVMDGIDATIKALKIYPDIKILVVSMYNDPESFVAVMDAGAKGYILKSSGKNHLESAIREVLAGRSMFSLN